MWELTAYSSPPEPLTVFWGPTPKRRGEKSLRRGGEGERRGRGVRPLP